MENRHISCVPVWWNKKIYSNILCLLLGHQVESHWHVWWIWSIWIHVIIQNDVLLKKFGGNNEAITSVCRDVQFLISYTHTEGSSICCRFFTEVHWSWLQSKKVCSSHQNPHFYTFHFVEGPKVTGICPILLVRGIWVHISFNILIHFKLSGPLEDVSLRGAEGRV